MTDDCSKCSTNCEKCKPNHHRGMQTRRYNDAHIEMPIILALKLLEEDLSPEMRRELIDCIQNAQ